MMKRKLYDYLDDSLTQADKLKAQRHLEGCPGCRERLNQLKAVLNRAHSKNVPDPGEEFWHDFKTGLDKKLNDKLVSPLELRRRPRLALSLKPAFAYAAVAIFFIAVFGSLHKSNLPVAFRLAQNDDELVEETIELDELEGQAALNHSEDAYLEEIDLLFEIEQA